MSVNLHYEDKARSAGFSSVCGVDEAGAGPLMGPVYAAAVILPRELDIPGLNDSKKLTEKKREKNLLDFEDMEHLALQILLKEEENGQMVPSDTALEYREQFVEILIDEYQDSNLVQEFLLQSISGEDDGRFNRFMVGDVKQSIYKFRLARPELFLEKFATYQKEDGSCVRVDLKQNFRSRHEVTDCVNDLFLQLMHRELGGVEYDADAALYPAARSAGWANTPVAFTASGFVSGRV